MIVYCNIGYVPNQRLRGAMLNAGVGTRELAHHAEVDIKSVARWITEDRVPHPITRAKVARALNQQETFLWPSLVSGERPNEPALVGCERIWASRSDVTTETWHDLFSRASTRVDILVYAGGFLLETLDLADVIRCKSDSGVTVRILIGDPGSDAVRVRGVEEDLSWLPERCRTTGRYLAAVSCAAGVSIGVHGTTLYASLYRFDDIFLVNAHTFGAWACQSPVYQIRRHEGSGLFDYYDAAFQRVWDTVDNA